MKRHNTIDTESPKYQYYSRSLPHWFDDDKPIFITYRLKFTLPQAVVDALSERKTQWFKELQSLDGETKQDILKKKDGIFFAWFDELLAKSGDLPQTLRQEAITDLIVDSFKYFDNIRYRLLAYCVMPNHVHVLIYPLKQENGSVYPLSHITYSWKKFTAAEINRLLGSSGNFWQQESYDHLVRDETELARVVNYIIMNPVKAKLVENWEDWHGSWVNKDIFG